MNRGCGSVNSPSCSADPQPQSQTERVKASDLHDFGQDGFVEVILQSRGTEIPLVQILLRILQQKPRVFSYTLIICHFSRGCLYVHLCRHSP